MAPSATSVSRMFLSPIFAEGFSSDTRTEGPSCPWRFVLLRGLARRISRPVIGGDNKPHFFKFIGQLTQGAAIANLANKWAPHVIDEIIELAVGISSLIT